MSTVFHLRARWRLVVLVSALLILGLPLAARIVAGDPGARINLRWQPSTRAEVRHALEAQFRLEALDQLDGLTWRYDLTDTSVENIRQIVNHPEVADTHEIDRPNYTVAATAVRTARRGRFAYGSGIVSAADMLAMALAAFATLLGLAALIDAVPVLRRLAFRFGRFALLISEQVRRIPDVARQLTYALGGIAASSVRVALRAVPEIDARTAGLFRIVFGAVTLAYFVYPSHRVDSSWLSNTFDPEIEGPVHAWVMEWLRAHPSVVDLITPWVITTGVAFVAGVLTRFTYTLFVAGVIVWAYVAMSIQSTHPHSTLVLTLAALIPARWGDAFSVDAWWRRHRGGERSGVEATKQYGYTVWVPVLTFGVCFAAAAWAKLTVPAGWTTWILNGTIKYHIVSDSPSAPVAWGLQLAHHPFLAVLASFGTIAIEALIVTAAFVRSERYRLVIGAAAGVLFCGIGLFMGIVWPGWWIPLLAFLPWQHWSRYLPVVHERAAATSSRRMTWHALTSAQLIVVACVIAQQVAVSALKLERAPMFSWYDMYARAYASPADYNRSIPPSYHVVVVTDRGGVQLACNPHGEFVRDFQAAVAGASEPRARVMRAIRACGADLSNARYVTLEGTARTFDWDRLQFIATYPLRFGPLPADP